MSRDQMIFRRAKSGYNVYQTQRHVVDSNSVLKYLALLSIVTAPRQTNGRKGYDADTLREVSQKSLNNINLWCRKSGLN